MKYFAMLMLLVWGFSVQAENTEKLTWPREIEINEYLITLYQPQLEALNQNILNGRQALSIKKGDEIIFGALWFDARLATDMAERTAVLEAFDIAEIKFPDVEDESKLEKLKTIIEEDFESMEMVMSLDRILADLEEIETAERINGELNNSPPVIYYRSSPAVLVLIDGEPIVKDVEGTKLQSVINTPFLILKKKSDYYIKGGQYWYTSKTVVSKDWQVTKKVPNDVEKAAKQMLDEEEAAPEENSTEIPDLIVTDKPSEIILSDGKLEYEPIEGTELLFVKNSENDILLEIKSQQHFVLLNGRWYSSKTLQDGGWTFVEPKDLPADFAKIPSEATIASVKASVPGTDEAKEAVYEQQMPQTAVVDRKTATTEVKYDGDPKFEKMEGTSVLYAINTESTVIKIDKTYYCVDEGIWFQSSNPTGPWSVSDERPKEVDEIPPSAPVHNVKYVYIYDSTPDVVYVGYTPGYYHSYYYGGCVVYGTGWYYRPWYGRYYYPRPVTYGFGVHYNPYTGWGFSAGFSYGWFTFSFHSHPAYWGPCGYRHGYRHGYHHGYHRGYHNGYRAGYARGRYDSRNMYRDRPGTRPTTNRRVSTQPVNRSGRPSQRPNNVYTDRNGNIHSRDRDGNWKQENKRPATRPSTRPGDASQRPSTRPSTQPSTRPTQPSQRPSAQPSTRPSTRPTQPSTRPSTQPSTRPSTRPTTPSNQLQRDYQNRSRGTQNYNNYQRSRPSTPSRSAPSRGASPSRMRR